MKRETVPGFTIDAAHSRDLDDALWIEPAGDGVVLLVSIADVAEHVPIGSRADKAAAEMAFSRYRAHGRSKPMFSTEADFSLMPESDPQPVVTFCVTLDATGEPLDDFLPRLCRLDHRGRLCYAQVDAILCGQTESPLSDRLKQLDAFAERLLRGRRKHGALAIYDIEHGWATDEEGRVVPIGASAHRSNVIVQECMILVNRLAADWLAAQNQAAVFRNHDVRPEAKDGFDREATLAELDEIFCGASVEAIMALRSRIAQALKPAEYGAVPTGHYGLNVPNYTHATSPIRRYADLVNQRIIRSMVLGEKPPYTEAEIQAGASRINDTTQSSKVVTANRYKAAADRPARHALARGAHLQELPEAAFLRVITVASREGWFPEPFVDAVVKRGNTGLLKERDFYPVIFETDRGSLPEIQMPAYARLLAEAMEWFIKHPSSVVTVLRMAQGKDAIGTVQYEVSRGGLDNATVFTGKAEVRVGRRVVKSKAFRSTTKKGAQQGAAVILLARLLDLADPDVLEIPGALPADWPKEEKGSGNGSGKDNPVGALGEFAAQKGCDAPVYEYGLPEGPAHAPTVVCTCRLLGHERKGAGRSKKAAKQIASAEMVKRVLQ